MARSTNNVVTHGLSGKIDLLVFSQRDGNTIVSRRPRRAQTVSPAQQEIRANFQQAVLYAKSALADDATRLAYATKAKPGQKVFNLAIADFFRLPDIGEIDVAGYTGQPGSRITILATDDFKVTSIKVKIENGDRSGTEAGEAILQADGIHWLYTATQSMAPLAGTLISVTATDLPLHSSTKQKIM